jgi:hypothetical protein
MVVVDRANDLHVLRDSAPPEPPRPEPGGPPFWEEWRGQMPDEEIEFIRICFEDFTSSWE